MTCRHSPNDSSCSSHKDYVAPPDPYRATPTTPDAEKYEILDVVQIGRHLVVKAKYPNCYRCAYEGVKIMVFTNTNPIDAMRWRKIDPHFGDKSRRPATEAPSPAARFPASPDGWSDALAYAKSKT